MRNGRKLVQMQRDGIYRRHRPGWIYEPSDIYAARTVIDRATIAARYRLARDYAGWCSNTVVAAEVKRSAKAYLKLVIAATEILALHTDYSLDESYDRFCRDG